MKAATAKSFARSFGGVDPGDVGSAILPIVQHRTLLAVLIGMLREATSLLPCEPARSGPGFRQRSFAPIPSENFDLETDRVDTIGRPVQPAVPAIPPLTQPLPKRPPRRRWLTATAVALALGFVATGIFAIMQFSALSAARQDLAVAEDEVQSNERRVKSLQGKVTTAHKELESVSESLDHARDYGDTCHAALSGYTKGLRLYYQAVRAGNRGDLETAHSLTRQAAAAFRAIDLSYLKCMNESPDEFQPV